MKVNYAQKNVLGSEGLDQTKAFNIRTTAHAFKMLSSGLYSDKVGAVLREIACNAMDAHIAAGTPDLPIEVKLPNRVDPQFYIRDWGPGLSHDEVMNLYTSYFASTKQTSNDFTGAFGLGSKSPFSYTDNFSVVSVHGGRKRTYSAYIGNDGSPTISLMADVPNDSADWEHGVSVGFPVKTTDYSEFTSKAQSIYQWFRVTPKVLGAPPVKKVVYGFESEYMNRADGLDQGMGTNVGVLMGNVFYPVNSNDVWPNGTTTQLQQSTKYLFALHGIVIKAKIGDVQVAASREGLQYDTDTVSWLRMALQKAAQALATDLVKKAEATRTQPWADQCKVKDGFEMWNSSGYFDWTSFLKATGVSTLDARRTVATLLGQNVDLPAQCGDANTYVRVVRRMPTPSSPRRVVYKPVHNGKHHTKTRYGTNAVAAYLEYEPSTVIVYGEAKHALARVKDAVMTGKYDQVLFITKPLHPGPTISPTGIQDQVAALAHLHIPTVDVNTLPIPAWATSVKGTAKARKAKNAGPAPIDDATPMMTWNIVTNNVEHVLYADQKGQGEHYMVAMHNWQYRDRSMRIYDKTAEDDRAFSVGEWKNICEAVTKIATNTGTPKFATRTVFVSAAVAKELQLKERKWPDTFSAIGDWFKTPAVQNGIAAKLAAWRPTVEIPDRLAYAHSWMFALLYLRRYHKREYDKVVRPLLTKGDVATSLDTLYDASIANPPKNGKVQTVPSVLPAYELLATHFGDVGNVGARMKTRTFVSPASLEETISKTYPLSAVHDVRDTHPLFTMGLDKVLGYIQYVFKS